MSDRPAAQALRTPSPQHPQERWRPGAHFTPATRWMNDPNGLVHLDGAWHLFFQHNPEGLGWGNMSWGHATSPDLVRWTEQPIALKHDLAQGGSEQVYSGSVVVDHANTSGFGRDGDEHPPLVAIYTSARPGHQAQSLAWSRDGGTTWVRHSGNPVLDRGSPAFRDPKVSWWDPADGGDGYWLMVAVEAEERLVVFYRSADLRHWEPLGQLGPLAVPGGFWECPDLFALSVDGEPGHVEHVLVLSANDETVEGCGTWYAVGSFDGMSFTPHEAGFRRLDHGPDNYAAITWNNAPEGRRVLIGWMANWAYARDLPTSPWRGAMTLPRELSLRRRNGDLLLVQRPVPEVARADQLTRHIVELDVRERPRAGFELLGGPGDVVRIEYDRDSGLLSLDRHSVAGGAVPFHPDFASVVSCPMLAVDGVVRLELFIDSCSVEVFAEQGESVLSALVFPASGTPLTMAP